MTLRFNDAEVAGLYTIVFEHARPARNRLPVPIDMLWPVERSQRWRNEVGNWLAFARTVENPPEDTR